MGGFLSIKQSSFLFLIFKVNIVFFVIALYINKTLRYLLFYFKFAVMGPTSLVKVASSVKVCVRTAHLVTSQPVNVITDVMITGLGHIVKVLEIFCFFYSPDTIYFAYSIHLRLTYMCLKIILVNLKQYTVYIS